ncbi:hypothetical protein DFAR_270003 [Desulfarculales bacterium]
MHPGDKELKPSIDIGNSYFISHKQAGLSRGRAEAPGDIF